MDVLKQGNRQFVTGVTAVTAMDGDRPEGLAVTAFAGNRQGRWPAAAPTQRW